MLGGLDAILVKIEEVSQKIAALEELHNNNTALITMNEKRHQNTDQTFRSLCPLIDTIFDVSTAPMNVQYDCCHESFTGTTGQIGGAMMCITQSYLTLINPAPFSQTGRGACDTTCGNLPEEFIAGFSVPE